MFKELFQDGFSLEKYIDIAGKNEKIEFFLTENNILFSEEIREKIKNIKDEIYIIASVETWCPYARTFTATVKKMAELNPKIKPAFVTMGRGLFEIADFLEIDEDDFVVPTALILNKDFNYMKSFIGFPKKYSETEVGLGKFKIDYFNGLKADEIVEEIL